MMSARPWQKPGSHGNDIEKKACSVLVHGRPAPVWPLHLRPLLLLGSRDGALCRGDGGLTQHVPADLLPDGGARHLGGDGGVGDARLRLLLRVHRGRRALVLPRLHRDGVKALQQVLAVVRIGKESLEVNLEVGVVGVVALEPLEGSQDLEAVGS